MDQSAAILVENTSLKGSNVDESLSKSPKTTGFHLGDIFSQTGDDGKERTQPYPSADKVPKSPNAADIARLDYMNRSSPTKPFPDGPLIAKKASENQLIHLRHVSGLWDEKVLSFTDFNKVEDELAKMKFSQRGTKYVLVPENDPDSLSIRSSAHVYEMPSLLALPGLPAQIIPGNYGANLGTPLELRKQGHASTLVAYIAGLTSASEAGKYRFFSLLSKSDALYKGATQSNNGVMAIFRKGDKFDAGFFKQGDSKLAAVVDKAKTFERAATEPPRITSDVTLRPINDRDIDVLIAEDAALMSVECQELATKTGQPVVTFVPLIDAFRYQLRRCALQLHYSLHSKKEVDREWTKLGCQLGEPGSKDWAFITWRLPAEFEILKNLQIQITRLRYNNIEQLQILLQSAVDVAESWGMDDGVRWITSTRSVPDLDELKIPYVNLIGNRHFPISRLSLFGQTENVPHVLFTAEPYHLT